MTLYIKVNPLASKFAKTLQTALVTKVEDRVYRIRHNKVLRPNANVFTIPIRGLDKLEQLNAFKAQDVACPAFTTTKDEIATLGAKTIFARTLLNSTNGRGIVEFQATDDVAPTAPLYVAYVPKKAEYRVHVFNDEVIDVQQKKKRAGAEEHNPRIRNLSNGYVFCRNNLVLPDSLGDLGIRAVRACGYLYGAVDIIYNEKQNKCYVLEVNSRPGIEGSTVDKYIQAIINRFNLTRK